MTKLLPLWAAMLLGCGLSTLPDGGRPTWCRVESEHFVLYTDQSEADARSTVSSFERALDAFHQLGWEAEGKLRVKLEVMVFADHADFDVFAGETGGFFLRSSLLQPLVVMPDIGRLDRWSTLQHELTHFIATQSMPDQPAWFGEGLATYFETAYFDPNQRFVIGAPPLGLHRLLRRVRRVPAHELLTQPAESDPRFYASAWLLVHYLMTERSDDFDKYQTGLQQGIGGRAAWSAAFPDLTYEQLDRVLERYFERGEFVYFTQPVKAYSGPEPQLTWLHNADVYALRARLYLGCPACGPDEKRLAQENLTQALKREPQHLLASVLRVDSLPKAQKLAAAQALTRAHPQAWLAWAMLALASIEPRPGAQPCAPEIASHLRELGASSPHALMLGALCAASAGQRDAALDLAARSQLVQRSDVYILAMHATLLHRLGECGELARVVARLRNALHAKPDPRLLANFERCQAH